jgi:hypothetical protein
MITQYIHSTKFSSFFEFMKIQRDNHKNQCYNILHQVCICTMDQHMDSPTYVSPQTLEVMWQVHPKP